MSAYTDAAAPFALIGERRYRVVRPIVWEVGREGSGLFFAVPAGTEFDVTVPWIVRWAFSPHDQRYHKAAAVHDTMLLDGWSRLTAGAEFAEALRADGVGRVRRFAMWLAVSLWRWR